MKQQKFELFYGNGPIQQGRAVFLSVAVVFLQACGGGTPPEAPPPHASVSKPLQKQVIEWDQYSARLESPETVTLSARVSGIIEKAPFVEGALVQKSDALFLIDKRPFKAAFDSAEANVARAKAQVALAEAHYSRYAKLQGTKAISAENFDEADASLKQAKADLGAAQAARDVAQLNLDWTSVTAPITGKISRKFVTEGNLVNGGSGQATALTTITSIDPMFCYATIPERSLVQYRMLIHAKQVAGDTNYQLPAAIELEGTQGFTSKGAIDFIDNQVSPTTGTVQIRARIPNPDGTLTAGSFARLRVQGTDLYTALLVPDEAIGTDQASRFLLVVGQDDMLEYSAVKLGSLFGNLRAISEGIGADDRVVVNGVQQLHPKTKVTPVDMAIDTQSFDASIAQAPETDPQVAKIPGALK